MGHVQNKKSRQMAGFFCGQMGMMCYGFCTKAGGQRLCLNLKRVCYEESTVYCFVGVCVWRRGGI